MNVLMAVSRVVAEAFVAGLWQGMVLVAVVALVLRVTTRLGAEARFGVWGLAFLAAVAVPFVHLPGHVSAAAGSGEVRIGLGWGFAVAGCWGLMMIWRLGRLVVQGLLLRRIWQDAVPFVGEAWVSELLGEMPRKPMLCTSRAVDAPSVIGFRAPKLLIPEWQISSLSEMEMRQIVLHECEHLRRGDDWMNLAQKVGLALFPLNPALLWADRRLSLEREMACDAGVIARTRRPFDYAECLTRLAEQRMGRRGLALALSAWGRESELGQRVHRLLRPVRSMGRGPVRVSVGALALALTAGSVELSRVPRLVSFADAAPAEATSGSSTELAPGGRMTPVVYREPVRMERTVVRTPVKARKPAHRRVEQDRSVWGRRVVLPAEPRAMLTSVEGEREGSPAEVRFRLVDAISTEVPNSSFAAVRYGDGWLIFQL